MEFLTQEVKFDLDMIKKYDKPAPRYTSYPPATEFTHNIDKKEYVKKIIQSNERKTPLSLYFHIPFCENACHFCGCNVIITRRKEVVKPYLDHLYKEMDLYKNLIDTNNRKVVQLHWGGGTPNYLSDEETVELFNEIKKRFIIDPQAEVSIEIDPRHVDKDRIFLLKEIGFNRVSFGIQDFNPKVQEAVNRIQPEEMIFNVMSWLKHAGFESVNIDLIYGLPYQTLETFSETIEKTIKLNPDRIAVFNFAYVPWLKRLQRNIDEKTLPPPEEKLKILQMTIEKLTNAGYVFIGMDHFAKPNDELAIAQRERTLHRNFQGYTTKAQAELFGFGATSISMLYDGYVQNYKVLRDYYETIESGNLPIERGVYLNQDDIIRRDVIMKLMCHFRLVKSEISEKYNINFDTYFETELNQLQDMEKDGLLKLYPDRIDITPIGRLLIRNIASTFDVYLRNKKERRFSKAI
ncbi:oxygen-independent coproporphyrinogen III oxidase [Sulfurihydrogenibium subterraneum]|uniref:oxygen-independent coproporphyrinogen III oxidase n=1 Tax=Sulfurihydrogenibium subterraneum TaxID=171121 RepID=UPI00048DDBC3|nr:oxygen-independent coproporphyrinogen III oxidase [Sulfurihydrogenibium subterraneum]